MFVGVINNTGTVSVNTPGHVFSTSTLIEAVNQMVVTLDGEAEQDAMEDVVTALIVDTDVNLVVVSLFNYGSVWQLEATVTPGRDVSAEYYVGLQLTSAPETSYDAPVFGNWNPA